VYKDILERLKDKKYAKPIIAILFITSIVLIYRGREEPLNVLAPIPVEVAMAEVQDLPIYLSSLGTVTPEFSADIKAQISGKLTKVAFQDGQNVKKGDLIAEIDSRSYRAQLTQYEGQLLRDQALLDNAKLDLKRYQDLWKENSVSKQVLDTQMALVRQYEGVVQLDQGLVDNAKVNLSYCLITAPFDGKIGLRSVSEGSLVQAGDASPIAIINVFDPISITFSIPESQLSELLHTKDLQVDIYDQEQKEIISSGVLMAIDNQIDVATGTVKLKAEFKNSDSKLFPNEFVNVRLKVKTLHKAITLPVAAVQYSPDGAFIYLVKGDKVEVVKVKVIHVSEGRAVISEGVTTNQMVVISGVDKLRDGVRISLPASRL
jgi:multidrug efflux system membrane fusion protein